MRHFLRPMLFPAIVTMALCGLSLNYSRTTSCAAEPAGRNPLQSAVQARKENAVDAAISALKGLGVPVTLDPSGRLRWIEAVNGEISDEAMQHLSILPNLEWLEIGGGKVTAAGTENLKGCLALRRLYIHDVDLSKDPLTWIANLRLEALSLQRTGVNAAALGQLKAAGTLTVLNLSENGITDEPMSTVARFTNLEVLALQNSRITGAGLAELRGMKRLNVLNLVNCRIVDSDLSNFVSMPNLRIVHAAGCNISDQAVKDLTATLSMLAVFR